MEGCVACGEIAEGKPLYKKLGTKNLKVEIYDALVEMQLINLPEGAKTKCYICWDCDATIAEEYSNYIDIERKRKCDEKKRKEQDLVRNQKTNKKLTAAYRKHHKNTQISKGDIPPVSKYRQKEQKKVTNRYYAANCFVCNNPFKNSKVGYLCFNMKKMVDDHLNVYEALINLGHEIVFNSNELMRRFICCQCYNKVRRSYKESARDAHSNSTITRTNGGNQPPPELHKKHVKRATTTEHAAEIAKLIPPGLEGVYKVIAQDAPPQYKKSNQSLDVLDDLSYTESDSDSSDNSVDHPRIWTPKTVSATQENALRTFIPKMASPPKPSRREMCTCASCGATSYFPLKHFWYSLLEMIPPDVNRPAVSIHWALKMMKMELKYTSKSFTQKEYICKSCFTQITAAYKDQVQADPTCTELYNSTGAPVHRAPPAVIVHRNNIPRPLSVKRKLAGETNTHCPRSDTVNPSLQQHPLLFAPNAMKRPRFTPMTTAIQHDHHLLAIINKSEHLRYRGKAVYLRSMDVNVVDVEERLRHIRGTIVPTERLRDIHMCSNFMRSVRNSFNGKCMLCLSEMRPERTCRWLEDPVCPPHLMVPLRWARLSLTPSDEGTDLTVDDGKVCTNCYNYVKREFMTFVKNKIGLSLDDEKVSLRKYKVSFDSAAMSIVADPLVPHVEADKKTPISKVSADGYNKGTPASEQNGIKPNLSTNSVTKLKPAKDRPSSAGQRLDYNGVQKKKVHQQIINKSKSSLHKKSNASILPGNDFDRDSAESRDSSVSSSVSTFSNEITAMERRIIEDSHTSHDSSSSKGSKPSTTELMSGKRKSRAKNAYRPPLSSTSSSEKEKSPDKPVGTKRKRESLPTSSSGSLEKKRQKLVEQHVGTSPATKINKRLFEDDLQCDEDYFQSSDNTAPFAQRKKIRTGTSTATVHQVIGSSTDAKSLTTRYQNIWQILQGISIDCLLSSNYLQPVKPESFTHGFLCVLNFVKDEIGASDTDVVQWLSKVFPVEFRNLGRKLCKEAVQRHLSEMRTSEAHLSANRFDEALPLSFYVTSRTQIEPKCSPEKVPEIEQRRKQIEPKCSPENVLELEPRRTQIEPKCSPEKVLEIEHRDEGLVHWYYYLRTVNLEKLRNGTGSTVAANDFNSGLVYALWKANDDMGGKQKDLINWLHQTSPEYISTSNCIILAKNAQTSHSFISENPSIAINLNLPIIFSKEKLQQVVFIDKTSHLCFIQRDQSDTVVKAIKKQKSSKSILKLPAAKSSDTIQKITKQVCKESNKIIQNPSLPAICNNSPHQPLPSCSRVQAISRQTNYSPSPVIPIQDLQASSTALVRVDPRDRAVMLASTSRGAPINIGSCMQLLPLVQPNGIVTLVPIQMNPTSLASQMIIPQNLTNASLHLPVGLSQTPPSSLSFNFGININELIASGAQPITFNNNDQLNKRIADLERKLKAKNSQKAICLNENINVASKQKD